MDRKSITIAKISGIPISLNYSWFLVFALLTASLALGYYPAESKGWLESQYWTISAISVVLIFASILLHELGHAWMALHYKLPVSSISLFIMGGAVKIDAKPTSALADFRVAIAGPAVNLALTAIFGFSLIFVQRMPALFAMNRFLFLINALLTLFNVLPVYPLDGGRAFRAAVWKSMHSLRQASHLIGLEGRVVSYIFIVFGVGQAYNGNFIYGIWIASIGVFLDRLTTIEGPQLEFQEIIRSTEVSQVMSRSFNAIRAEVTLQQLFEDQILLEGGHSFIVSQGNGVAGLVTLHQLVGTPKTEWQNIPVASAMIPVGRLKQIEANASLWEALGELDRDGVNQLPVTSYNGQIFGVLSRADVITYLRSLH